MLWLIAGIWWLICWHICAGSLVRRWGDSLLRICGGSLVGRCGGSLVRICGGLLIGRCDGTLVERCGGPMREMWWLIWLGDVVAHLVRRCGGSFG